MVWSRLTTPAGKPASCRSWTKSAQVSGVSCADLADDGAARGQRRARLAHDHQQREIPGRYQQARTDGLMRGHHAEPAVRTRRVGAVQMGDLLGEPEQEVGGQAEFRPRLGQRLAAFQRHRPRDDVGPFEHEAVGGMEKGRTCAGRHGTPGGLGAVCSVESGKRLGRAGVGDVRDLLAVGRIANREAGRPGAPGAGDEEAAWYRVECALGFRPVRCFGQHVAALPCVAALRRSLRP